MISAVVITKNEEKNIKDCLSTLDWADEIIVIDSHSKDRTREIAEKIGARVYLCDKKAFDEMRNLGSKKATGNWLLYVDADERVSDKLREEILSKVKDESCFSAYRIPRLNMFFGHPMKHGGWYPDYQTRLFKKSELKTWFGAIHESAKVEGEIGKLDNHFIHLTHLSISQCFKKSAVWTEMEAELFNRAGHPKVTIFHLVKVSFSEFIDRVILKRGMLDGTVGWLEGIIQAYNKFLVYAQLWEKQQKSSR